MYKSILFLSVCLITMTTSLSGQKIIKNNLGKIRYVQPAASSELANEDNYHLKIILSNYDDSRKYVATGEFNLPGYSKVQDVNASGFQVILEEARLGFVRPRLKTHCRKFEEDGVQKVVMRYSYRGKATYKYHLIILKDGQEIYRDVFEDHKKFRGPKMPTENVALECYNKDEARQDTRIILSVIEKLEDRFSNQFVDLYKSASVKVFKVKESKYEYPMFNRGANQLEHIVNMSNAERKNSLEAKQKIDATIDSFSKIISLSSPKVKRSKYNANVTGAAHYNLAIAYFIKGDFTNAHLNFDLATKHMETKIHHEKLLNISSLCAERANNLARQ